MDRPGRKMRNLPSAEASATVEAEHLEVTFYWFHRNFGDHPVGIVVTWRVIESRLSKFLWPHIQIGWPLLEASKAFVDVFKLQTMIF